MSPRVVESRLSKHCDPLGTRFAVMSSIHDTTQLPCLARQFRNLVALERFHIAVVLQRGGV